MADTFSDTDSKPWYRQFWLWFLVSLPATVVVAGFITLYIAHQHADDLVVDDYYREGLGINQELEKKQQALALGIGATLAFTQSDAKHSVEVLLTGVHGQGDLKLLLSHPFESDRDFVILLKKLAPGVYNGEFDDTITAHWHWVLDNGGTTRWRLDGSIQESDFSDESFQ